MPPDPICSLNFQIKATVICDPGELLTFLKRALLGAGVGVAGLEGVFFTFEAAVAGEAGAGETWRG